MTIAAYATGCEHGYLYIRAEYPLAHARLENALAQARAAGLLGDGFDIELRIGAGAYVCGEETALFQSIEGYRGEPRNKPPFPVEVGLFGKPTVVNNVETLANVPAILNGDTRETRLFCVSGDVGRPGLYELELGTPLRELLELAEAEPAKAVLLGGAAGTFLGPGELDLRLDFEASLGSGVVMVFGPDADLGAAVLRIAEFFRDESCGQCVPVPGRDGSPGGGAAPPRCRPAERERARGARRPRAGDARRVDLRARADGGERGRVGEGQPRGAAR